MFSNFTLLDFTSDGFSLSACIDPIIRHDGPGGDSSDEIYHMDFTVQSKVFSNSNCDCNTDKFIFNFRNQDEFFIQANSNNLGCGNLSQWSSNPWNFSLTCIE
jgi:hypothetical protein